MKIVELIKEHWLIVADIYREGIETRNATFRTEVPDWKTWNSLCHKYSRFVAINETKEIVGWCAVAPVSNRIEYRGVAEVSVYVRVSVTGKNIGSLLMEKLISSSEENNIWSLYSSMFPENIGSVKLHEKYDFRYIGYREKIAKLNGVWKDTVLYERRSKKVNMN